MSLQNKTDIFLSVIQTHKGIIYKVANSYCRDAEDRKDLVQEIMIQLWRSFDNYNDEYKYTTWMYRIALNTAISFYRKESLRDRSSEELPEDILDLIDKTESAQDENINILLQFIHELKELDKALMLLYLEEKSHKEIAAILGITETNVATKIGRIKNILKQKFSNIQN